MRIVAVENISLSIHIKSFKYAHFLKKYFDGQVIRKYVANVLLYRARISEVHNILLSIFQMPTFIFLNRFLHWSHSLESSLRDYSNKWPQHRIRLRLKKTSKKILTVRIVIMYLYIWLFLIQWTYVISTRWVCRHNVVFTNVPF